MRRVALLLVALGAAALLAGGWLRLSASRGQDSARIRWKREAANGVSATDALTRLSFPDLGRELFVAEGASKQSPGARTGPRGVVRGSRAKRQLHHHGAPGHPFSAFERRTERPAHRFGAGWTKVSVSNCGASSD